MKKKSTGGILLAILASVFALVAILCAIAPGFTVEQGRGTGFIIMFGATEKATVAVPGLIVAFILEIVIVFVSLIAAFSRSKGRVILNLFSVAAAICAAVLLLFAKTLYVSANGLNPADSLIKDLKLASGFITSIVFDFLSAACSLLVVYISRRKED